MGITRLTMADKLIILLAKYKGILVTYDMILSYIPDFVTKEYIHTVVCELRSKGYKIETMNRVGYKYMGE